MFSCVASKQLQSSVCCTVARSGSTVATSGILEHYQRLVNTQELQPDPRQLHVAEQLQQLQNKLLNWQPPPVEAYDEWINHNPVEINAHDADALPGTRDYNHVINNDRHYDDRALPKSQFQTPSFGKTSDNKNEGRHTPQVEPPPRPVLSPQGIYLHGHVGSGKSMLMDMFFESITTTSQSTQQLLHGATNASAGHEQIVAVRTHFQPFMVELLDTLHNWRREDTLASVFDEHERARWEEALNNSTAVLTRAAAKSIAGRCRLMCFDEVQIPDPCSAALVHSLFSSLLQYGVVLVATSNRPPHELDGGGFRGASFTPFVNMLVDHCDVLNLSERPGKQMQHHAVEHVSHAGSVTGVAESTGSGAVDKCVMSEHGEEDAEEEEELPCFDYRLSNAEAANVAASPPFFLYPGSDHISDATGMSLHMDALWSRALASAALEQEELIAKIDALNEECDGGSSVPVTPPPPPPPLKVYGREISGQVTSECGSIARFDFDFLCGDARPLGPADYNAIARRYHTVFVDGVPAFHMFNRHLARRLIWFVDALYESRANLVASAAAAPLQLFQPTATSQSEAADVMALESLGSLSETATGRFALADAPPQFLSAPKAPSTFRPEQLELFTGAEDVFAFERCVSRLMEMQTPTYRSQQHRSTVSLNSVSGSPAGFGSMPGAPPPLPVEEEEEDKNDDEHEYMAPPREVDINQLRPLPRRQRRSERVETVDTTVKPKFTDRHFWGMGTWGKRAGEWGKGSGPRMGGPNPWWTITKVRITRALGLSQELDPLSSTPPSLRVKIDNLFSSVRTLKNRRRGPEDDGRSASQ